MSIIATSHFQLAVYQQGDLQAKKLALVLPGKLDTKDYPHMRSQVEYLAKKGYLALSFDPPGTWESPGDISLYSMKNYLTAINDLITHFGNRPTFVVGHSRGGSMAMLAGTRNPFVTHFASIMSFYSFEPQIHGEYPDKEWEKDGYRISKRDLPGKLPEFKEFRVPYSFLEDQIRYDALEDLKKSPKPKLFILGKKDILVKPKVVQTAFDAAHSPKELRELDSDHDYRHSLKLIGQVNKFLGEFLDLYAF